MSSYPGAIICVTIAIAAFAPRATSEQPLAATAERPANDTLVLDLPGAVRLALDNSTPIRTGADSVRLSGISLLESYGRFLPALTTTIGGFDESGNTLLSATSLVPADAQFYGVGYQLSAGVNLFNGFRDREHFRASSALRDAQSEGFDRAKQQVAYDVTQAFYQVVLDRRLSAIAAANLALSEVREQQLTDQVRIGTRAPPDLYRQQAQTAADKVLVIDADNRVESDGTALLRRLHVDPMSPYRVEEPPVDTTALPAESLRADVLVGEALRLRPDLASADNKTLADTHDLAGAHGSYLPRVNLRFDAAAASRVFGHESVGGVDQLTVSQRPLLSQLGNQWTGALSLGVSWDLFDNYRYRLDVERATVSLDRDRLVAEDLRLRVSADVKQALGDYRAAEEKLSATGAEVAAADEAFNAVQGRYDVGLASFIDVLSAQTARTRALAAREQALIGVALQKAVLRYVTAAP